MRLHFIRHGETNWNAIRRIQGQMESHLTELGKQQAEQLAEHMQVYPISQVYCSSSVRTRETASILFRSLPRASQPSISYQDNLREIHLGPWEGNFYDDLAQQDPEQFHNFWNEPHQFSLTGAETFQELQQRGIDAVNEIVRQSPAEDAAIVSHGALIKSILCHFEERPLSRLWEPPRMHNCAHSIMKFDGDGQGRIIRYAGIDYRSEAGQQG
ncbi:MAG: histidine phosphatase family protein [Gammaproteobacteria bacterium]|nr:histidine phosphatase family protein [Gammaproteobacteria bacterium]